MSQESHRIYKRLVPLEKQYKYHKRYLEKDSSILLKYKYDYLKLKLEHDTIVKRDDYREKIELTHTWYLKETRELIESSVDNDNELIILRRIVMLLKNKLLNYGYKKIYL